MEKSSIEKISILSDGYGLAPRIIARDLNLSPGSKALYFYLSSFAGAEGTCFPSRDIMTRELDMHKNSFTKYLNELKASGYIKVHKNRKNGKIYNNVYEIVFDKNNIERFKKEYEESKSNQCPKKQDIVKEDKEQCLKKQDTVKQDTAKQDTEKADSNSNSINNNSININSFNSSCSCIGELDKILEFYITNISKENITLFEKEEIEKLYKQIGYELLLEAMKISVKNKRQTLAYIHGIAKKWLDAKITTLEELKIYEVKYSKNNTSNSFNQTKKFIPNFNPKVHNFSGSCDFTKYTPEELEKILFENQRLKESQKKKTRFHNFDERGSNYTPEELENILLESQKGKFN